MRCDDAWSLLGLEPTDDADELRRAFLSAIRDSHPDVAAARSGADPALVTEAYRVVRLSLGHREEPLARPAQPVAEPEPPAPPRTTSRPSSPRGAPLVVDQRDAESVSVSASVAATFGLVVEALDEVGDVTFIDRSSGLAQALVTFVDGPVCYVHVAVSGRAQTGSSEVALTVESLQQEPPPPLDAVTALIADALRRVAGSPTP